MHGKRTFLLTVGLLLAIQWQAQAGTLTTAKLGARGPLLVTFTPDPNGQTACTEMTITVRESILKPSTMDRNLQFRLYVSDYYHPSLIHTVNIHLPQGATSTTVKMPFYQSSMYGYWLADVFEDGNSIVTPRPLPSYVNNQNPPGWLEILADAQSQGANLAVETALGLSQAATVTVSQASSDWRIYLTYNAVVIDRTLLDKLSESQWSALSTYALAGGCLVATSADRDTPTRLDELTLSKDIPGSRWQLVKPDSREILSKRAHGGGIIVAVHDLSAAWEDRCLNESALYPVNHLATSQDDDSLWFWRNLVLSVGRTPVWPFVGFITLLVVVLGPVLLRLTTKLQHRTLLLFLVPAISLVATLIVMFYNVVREGFGTRGRVAALQFVDTTTGQGFTWARQSYFSGAPGRDGLQFPVNAFLKPTQMSAERRHQNDPRHNVRGLIENAETEVRLRDWLLPRSQQSVFVGFRTDHIQLPIETTATANSMVRIHNKSTNPIAMIVLRGSEDTYYVCEDLAAGQQVEVASMTLADMESKLRSIDALLPAAPAEVGGLTLYSYGYGGTYQSNSRDYYGDPIDSVLRRRHWLHKYEGAFLIISQSLPSMPLPYDKSIYDQEQNFHVLTGVTQW